jgi:dipeptide/tripeptide permease
MSESKTSWRFPRVFWIANGAELCERAAYYGTFIALRTYLIRVVGLDDIEAGTIAGLFSGWIYLVPFFMGALADRIGFRKALMLAFLLLTLGYGSLGIFNTLGPVLVGLGMVVLGGAIVKPVITGTASKSSTSENRARAFSIFYMVVNIGSFTGKTVVAPMRIEMGVDTVPFFSAGAALVALILVAIFYRPREDRALQPRNIKEVLEGMWMAIKNLRFFCLILITAGFWAIQHQLYASMPDYVLRLAGEEYKPEWYANINPLVVVIFVVLVTQLVRKWRSESSILVSMLLITISPLVMSMSHLFNTNFNILGMSIHPITAMLVLGIALQGLAECFLSPKYLEYASKQAPGGKEGIFLGFAHINVFFSNQFAFIFSGFLLDSYCPEPSTLSGEVRQAYDLYMAGQGPLPEVYANAHYIWYAYAGVGAVSLLGMLVYIFVTKRIDARRMAAAKPE